ncbi:MAG TPA: hypothetical protein PKZ80_03765 [Thermoleophilia bacterium]|nr:MAG: hypothetical protein BWY94_01101 [Actinobacteria bacterium ADurb.BinA094]HQF52463.1 hypothetical protein [Thermoleophilia bacterium]HQJ26333.1 hypothetical protein [Thermoleophilia bacterium]
MISNDLMRRRNAGDLIDHVVDVMISVETMKERSAKLLGAEFPLVLWQGNGRIVASDDVAVSLLVRGVRVDLTWERLAGTWSRFLSNHTLTVDELGGAADGVGIVSLFAFIQGHGVSVLDTDGLLVFDEVRGTPVHQYADMSRPTSWAPWRRRIHAD